jgi:phage baseplate assembly protein W
MAMESDRLFSDPFAYDLAKDILTKGEAYNEEAINLSINNILSTIFTERLFKSEFGSSLQLMLFESITTTQQLQYILNSIISSLKQWETRIWVIEDECIADFDPEQHLLYLKIPYIINKAGIVNTYESNIRVGL